MQKRPGPKHGDLSDDMRARQRNTLWYDTVFNGRRVDVFLWRGSPGAPLVQRIGAWIIGAELIGLGCLAVIAARKENSMLIAAASIFCFGAGYKVFRNGFRRNKREQRTE